MSPRALALQQAHGPGPVDWERLAAAVEQPAWLPIALAEKDDGVPVLLSDGRDVFEGYWEAARGFWACSDGGAAYPTPTYFMPLPAPPADREMIEETGRG